MKRLLFLLLLVLLTLGGFTFQGMMQRLDKKITTRFEGRRWELPARIYARPLELYPGRRIDKKQLVRELELLGYRPTEQVKTAGTYRTHGSHLTLHARAFDFADGKRPAKILTLTLKNKRITSLVEQNDQQDITLFRLEPLQIAAIYPGDNEDRLLIKLQDTPPLLVKILLLTEDRQFYQHIGIRPPAILRALLVNLRAGKTVQGGSTLTQQLVKNFFLSSEQSLKRKINEALMALLLEHHYSKDEILETYINEIYLGQDGNRAIHGFAMASRFYFERNIDELSVDQLAMLVGLAKGASFYDPRRHPDRAKSRRNLILTEAAKAGLLSPANVLTLRDHPLGVTKSIPSGITKYPAFIDLVRRQLTRDYKEEDLHSEGLSIFTTLDPIIQQRAEESLQQVLSELEQERKMVKDTLQGAMVLCSVDQGEVQAVVGDRFPRRAGFNRALDMRRPIGSVVKPAVYLSALSQPDRYNLLTMLADSPLSLPTAEGNWQPHNYDNTFHGQVPLRQALVHSLNVATVQLGMEIGIDTVIDTLHALGITDDIAAYPSLLLGALDMDPINVLQMYQSLAAGGYQTPLRTILAVTGQNHHLLQRYPLTVKQAANPAAVFCLNTAMREVTKTGTAQALQRLLPPALETAGKTGTTNDLRDSWFAGFSGSHVAVAWVGRDDNQSTGLTGATGALRVWARLLGSITTSPLDLQPPADIDFYFSDIRTGRLFADQCRQGELVPFIRGGILPAVITCSRPAPHKNRARREGQPGSNLEQSLQKGIQQFLRIFQ